MGTLDGRTAVVTGGTGGLGAAVVEALLSAGARVAVPFRKPGELERLRQSSGISGDAPLWGSLVDVTDEGAVAEFYESVAEDRGGLQVVVNAAGSFEGGSPAHETAWEVWQRQLDSNLKTAVVSSRAAVPRMLRSGGGAIVNVSSRPALQSGRNLSAYAAAKRAVLALTDAMAAELVEKNVTVNAVLPSTIDTPANRRAMPDADFGKWVKPAEIARVILFLVGPDARIVSGAHLPVYGRS
jgi:NAD(P)-dependent dehydrogenase (short-subunit alcohol dehydrogenase family)